MGKQITLYITQTCPWAARARIAIREANVPFTEHDIDLQNKPHWYLNQVNPAGLVPAIAYGGPAVPPDQPSPESLKLRESLPIVEWIADEFPQSGLLPKSSSFTRYKARLFSDVVVSKLLSQLNAFVFRGDGSPEALLKGVKFVQAELAPDTKYAVSDEFSTADAASAPFIFRLIVFLKYDLGVSVKEGEGKKLYDTISTDAEYSQFWNYAQNLLERPSVKEVLNEKQLLEGTRRRLSAAKQNGK